MSIKDASEDVTVMLLLRLGYREPRKHSDYQPLVNVVDECLREHARDLWVREIQCEGIPSAFLGEYESAISPWWTFHLVEIPWIGTLVHSFLAWRMRRKYRKYERYIKLKLAREDEEIDRYLFTE